MKKKLAMNVETPFKIVEVWLKRKMLICLRFFKRSDAGSILERSTYGSNLTHTHLKKGSC